jgi:predicted nucleic acid-binding protein
VARKLILDTGVLVAPERRTTELADAIDAADDVVIAAITVAELCAGIELADPSRRAARAEFLIRVLETCTSSRMTCQPRRMADGWRMRTARDNLVAPMT